MKVAFMFSTLRYDDEKLVYGKIEDYLLRAGHEVHVPVDYSSIAELADDGNILDEEDWAILCDRTLSIASTCDVAIIDVTDKATFGVGFFAAKVLQLNKSTLFLMREGSLGGSFISGLQHPSLTRNTFNNESVLRVVGEFLKRAR